MTSLRNKLWLGFGSLLLILLIVSVLSIVVFTRYSHALERVFRENYDSAVYCDTMKESLDQLNAHAQRLIWQQSIAQQSDYTKSEARFESALASQSGNVTLPGELEATRHLADLWGQYRQLYQNYNDASQSRSELYDRQLGPRYIELRQVAQHIGDMNMSNMVSVDGK